MEDRYKVLVLGSSTYTYTEGDPNHAFPALLHSHLSASRPDVAWECDSEIVYTTLTMPGRVRKIVRESDPDLVMLMVSSMHFTRDDVVNVLRRRAPFLYRPARSFAQWLRDVIGGGGPRGANSARGWLYRAPRWLVERVVGSEPTITVEDAVEVVTETIDDLLRVEDLSVIVGLPTAMSRDKESQRRRQAFLDGVMEVVEDRRVPYYIPAKAWATAWVLPQAGTDGWHNAVQSRNLSADMMARAIAHWHANTSMAGEVDLFKIVEPY